MLKIFGFVLSLLLLSGVARAEDVPTLDQVYKTAQSGRLDDAERMMGVVLKEHPNSAKAHFVEAELLAKQGKMDMAEAELGNAERLKPGLSFASPQAVQNLKGLISASHRAIAPQAEGSGATFPWGMLLIGLAAVAVLFFVMRAFASRQQASSLPVQGAAQPAYGQPGYGQPAYGQPVYNGAAPVAGGGMGSGIMGGLATGAAVGVGMVAGEALAHHFMDGGHAAPAADNTWGGAPGNLAQDNMGGTDFGIADNASWDDGANIASSSDSDWG